MATIGSIDDLNVEAMGVHNLALQFLERNIARYASPSIDLDD